MGNTSVFFNNAEGFSVTPERKRGETKSLRANKPSGFPKKWQISSPAARRSRTSPLLPGPAAPALPNPSKIADSSKRFPSPSPTKRLYLVFKHRRATEKKLKIYIIYIKRSIQPLGRRVIYSLWRILPWPPCCSQNCAPGREEGGGMRRPLLPPVQRPLGASFPLDAPLQLLSDFFLARWSNAEARQSGPPQLDPVLAFSFFFFAF